MTNNADRILEKKRNRDSVLKAAYDIADGSLLVGFETEEIQRVTGLANEEIESCLKYLNSAGLTKIADFESYSITHEGVAEIEKRF